MKASVWMVAVLAALVAHVNGDGICYDPKHNGAPTLSSVSSDMALIKQRGFTMVRTYISKLGDENMAKVVATSGLAAALGVPYANDNYAEAKAHADAAIAAANANGANVQYIFVGNENLMSASSSTSAISEMKSLISYIKGQVSGSIKVGTVQRAAELSTSIRDGTSDLINACDAVGTNIHPFFHPSQQVSSALDTAKSQWNGILSSGLPNIASKLVLSETGWPSEGCSTVSTCGSLSGAAQYWAAYKTWGLDDSKRFYFQGFDQPYRSEAYEQKYGIWASDGTAKFTAAGSGTAVTTAPATTTPTPTTTATATTTPTPTTAVTSNSTDASTSSDASSKASSIDGSGSNEAGSVVASQSTESSSSSATTSSSKTLADEDTADHKANSSNAKGDLESETIPESSTAQTSSSSSGTGFVGVFLMSVFGVGIVAVAAAFIYKARQKAAALDRESKDSDALSITPGGACVL